MALTVVGGSGVQVDPLAVSDYDRTFMTNAFKAAEGNGLVRAIMHFLLKDLGMPQDAQADKGIMVEALEGFRADEGSVTRGRGLAAMHEYLLELGLRQDSSVDVGIMDEQLSLDNGNREGYHVACMLYRMNKLGHTRDVKPYADMIREQLASDRRNGYGAHVAGMYKFLGGLGVLQDFVAQEDIVSDFELMERQLGISRDARNGMGIAEMHHMIRAARSAVRGLNPPMPPPKGIG